MSAQTTTKSSKEIVKAASEAAPTITAEEAFALAASPDPVFVDARGGAEPAMAGVIARAVAAMEIGLSPALNVSGGAPAWTNAGGALEKT